MTAAATRPKINCAAAALYISANNKFSNENCKISKYVINYQDIDQTICLINTFTFESILFLVVYMSILIEKPMIDRITF